MNKIWPSDLRISCYKPLYNLLEVIEINAKIEDLEEFEKTFQRDEIVKI